MSTSTEPIQIVWVEGSSIKQYFTLPSTIVYYMTMNPSTPTCYLKMAQSCKYFFEKNPINVISRIKDEEIMCPYNEKKCHENDEVCCMDYDVEEIIFKIWLTHKLSYIYRTSISNNFAVMFNQKIYRCESAELFLDDFQLLVASFTKFNFNSETITDNGGNIVTLDKIIETIPNVIEFEFMFDTDVPVATASTLKNICDLKNLGNLKSFILWDIPEILPVEDFYTFIQNKHENTKVKFDFDDEFDGDYKTKLDQLIDYLIESQIPNVLVEYEGQDEKKLEVLESL